jgi:hypothetical protein
MAISNPNTPMLITAGFAERLNNLLRDYEQRRPGLLNPHRHMRNRRRGSGGTTNKFGRISKCNFTTGIAEVEVGTGTIGSLTFGGETVEAWVGVSSYARVGDDCVLIDNGDGITPQYTAYVPIRGIYYEEPEVGELSEIQDEPAADTAACDDTIT